MNRQFPGVVLIAMVLLFCGCASRKPLRAVSEKDRLGLRIVDGTRSGLSDFSSANARAMHDAGSQSALVPGVVLHAAAVHSNSKGVSWVSSIRAQSGIHEGGIVLQKVLDRVRKLQELTVDTNAAPVLTVEVQKAGLAELQRGGWFGAHAGVSAQLTNKTGESLWTATAYATSAKLRRREEFDQKPTLYSDDFTVVAEDIARQLIEGPIR
jgi:hypothetical protein